MQRSRLRLVGALLSVTAVVLAVGAGAGQSSRMSAESSANVLAWNLIAVSTVRAAAPAKAQVEGLVYMSYVQASVYDAVTKIEGRYAPYHDFAAPVSPTGASPDAAVGAAAYTILSHYFPSASLTTTYLSFLAGLPTAGRDAGVAIGTAAAEDIIASRTGDGLGAAVSPPF